MKIVSSNAIVFRRPLFSMGMVALVLLVPFLIHSQQSSTVSAAIDTAKIKIGEQIQYTITVETDSLNLVHFPQDQTFSPLEMVEALKIDSTKKKDRITLQRIYALTQFDSGTYIIPPQRIAINEEPFLTDSFKIAVVDVAVDTTKQKMYDIKPLVQVERNYANVWKWLFILLGVLAVLGALAYWFVFRKKPLTEEEKVALLPPYDRALLQLKELENSRYLIQDEFKKYYSELTNIVRSYLEEEVHISALESTTDQLIERLELRRDAGELELGNDTIAQFKKVLQTADLVKFAKSKPAMSVAEEDRQSVRAIVEKTKEALPEPDEEELLEDEEYVAELGRKQRTKRLWYAAAAFAALLVLGLGTSIAVYGFGKVKDNIIGHPTKELLESEWVNSSYGYPPISIATPKVLTRHEIDIPEEAKEAIGGLDVFGYRSAIGLFTTAVSTTRFTQAVDPDFDTSIEQLFKQFEAQGARNIIQKQEEFFTKSGVTGLKTFGSGKFKVPESEELVKGKYAIISFGGKGFMQQVILTWLQEDEYAEKIVQRILASIDINTET